MCKQSMLLNLKTLNISNSKCIKRIICSRTIAQLYIEKQGGGGGGGGNSSLCSTCLKKLENLSSQIHIEIFNFPKMIFSIMIVQCLFVQ